MTELINRQRRGVTLIELIVTIAVLGVILGMSALSLAGEKRTGDTKRPITGRIRALRSKAILAAAPQSATIDDSTGTFPVTALPDGRVITDMPRVGRLSGVTWSADAR